MTTPVPRDHDLVLRVAGEIDAAFIRGYEDGAAAERERLREIAEARKGALVLRGLLADALPWTMLIGLIDDIQAEAGDHVA